jgi:hypothetical protein
MNNRHTHVLLIKDNHERGDVIRATQPSTWPGKVLPS